MQSIFEATGGTYHQAGNYLLPDLEAPASPCIGVWGQRRRRYLREQKPTLYTAMLLGGTLNAHLEEVDRVASEMFALLVNQFKEREGITEPLKAADQWEWFRQMNSIGNRVVEIINEELIYT